MVEVYFLSIKSRLQQCLICFLPTFLLLSSGMVTFPVHFRMLFFCQFQKVSKIPLNYRGIALASCVSKVLEWCIILTWSQYFVTDDLQFGFIPDYSTTLCTGIINCYIKWSSNIYACLIDTSKAFDTVDHYVLFEKLITKSIPILIARFLLYWYHSQLVCVRWDGTDPPKFSVSNSMHQGGVLSPILFAVYVDSLLCALRESGHGCYWHSVFAGALCYADDLTILAPSADGMRKMVEVCKEFARSHIVSTLPKHGLVQL